MPTLTPGPNHAAWEPRLPVELVLLDVDGTLMGHGSIISDAVVDAVREAVDRGVRVGIATGRNAHGVQEAGAVLPLTGPHIVLNGSQVRMEGRAVRTWAMSGAQLRALLSVCDAHGFYAELYTDEGVLVTAMDRRFEQHWTDIIGMPIGTVGEHPELLEAVIKTTIVTLDDASRDIAVPRVRELGLTAGVATSPITPGWSYINITRGDADKGVALATAAELIGVDLRAVMAVGDGANDIPMLAAVGTAVAMGDAPEALRALAHHVAPTVEGDGAATALRAALAWNAGAG